MSANDGTDIPFSQLIIVLFPTFNFFAASSCVIFAFTLAAASEISILSISIASLLSCFSLLQAHSTITLSVCQYLK